jgi:3-oxoacyl-[acyl-carrier-protein] synthase II
MNEKIVVSGLNVISCLGNSMQETWENLLCGKSGITKISLFDASELETQFAGQVNSKFDNLSAEYIKKRTRKQMTRVSQMSLVATKMLIEKQNINFANYDPLRCAVVMGVVHTGNTSVESNTMANNLILKGMNNAIPAWISLEYGLEGPSFSVATACASSSYAIAQGYELIKNDKADFVIVGGADSTINPEEISGFNAIHALSTNNYNPQKASCPFSADRDGFVIGEGAGIIVLEKESFAKKRNATIYAEIVGYALTTEAFNIMAPKTEGEGMAKTMLLALENAGINKNEVDYINAHGTSTTLNDAYESKAIETVFGEHASNICISSSKSMIGHTIGAAGAIEAAITAMSVHEQIMHPTINLDNPDPALKLDYLPHKTRKKNIRYALSNSFAFGGHNSCIVLKKYNQ